MLDNPKKDPNSKSDPYCTLFVTNLSFSTTEATLEREFGVYGPIKSLRVVKDVASGKSRGYAFIEFKNERDFRNAYERAYKKRVDGRRIIVDYERARVSKDWLPKRLGGGIGAVRTNRKLE